ncbi:hypothetical protein AFK69_06385 [Xenorhabdus sp. GDc328]|nr:hypothetical protein AAY47_12485 [Xenorhabdus griffiniae]KOP34127.1 hypothetical protein AFK69_06385 [Xenorhabdus sp. GDc328]
MASTERTDKLIELVNHIGSTRKAENLIKSVKNVAPTHSAIYKSMQGSGTDYIVQCYIDDLLTAIRNSS